MKRFIKLQAIVLAICLIFNIGIVQAETQSPDSKIKNIIFMIPDGGGMTPFLMADAVKQAGGFNEGVYKYATPVEKGEMYAKQYWVGAQTTYSASNAVTDSAAAGTALSTGKKTTNKYIGVDPDIVPIANILEASQRAGKKTGLVVTFEWTNATPATFAGHDISRASATVLAEQMVNQGIDVVLGNKSSAYEGLSYLTDDSLEERGYEVVNTKEQLASVKKGDRLWSKFSTTLYSDISNSAATPTLVDMTKAAITALENDEEGFFLMVEGSRVDSGGHSNAPLPMMGDFMAFDVACQYAIEFAKNRDDTIVLITPDHDTGGMYWDDENLAAIVKQIQAGNEEEAEKAGLNWTTTNHTNWDGGLFIYAPEGVSYPEGIDISKKETAYNEFAQTGFKEAKTNRIDNTDIPKYLAGFIGVDLDQLSKELFVDVTDKGTYNATNETFIFDNVDSGLITVKRNESVATCNGVEVDLEGEITVYCNDRFYVPQKLIDKTMGSGASFDNIDITDKGTYNSTTEVFTLTDYDAYFKNLSNVIVYKGQEITMNEDVAVYLGDKFYVPEKAMELIGRLESGEFGKISVIADCNTKKINVSGWVGAPNAKVSMMAVEEGTNLAEDFDAGKIIAMCELKADYNGDYSTSIAVTDENVAGNYTFYINYKNSNSKNATASSFSFKNTVPTMDVVDKDGGELMYMEQLKEGDAVNVILKGFDNKENFDGVAVIAQYDKDGNLVHANIFHDVDNDSVEQGSEIRKSATVVGGAHKIKVMYWEYNTLCPMFGVYTVYTRGDE